MTSKFLTFICIILLLFSLIINALIFLGFWSGTLKIRHTLSAEVLEPLERTFETEVQGEVVFNRFAVSIEKNQNELKSFSIADTFFKDMLFMGQFLNGQYHLSINYGIDKSMLLVLNAKPPYQVKEAWYTFGGKTKMDFNMDGTFNLLLDINDRTTAININDKWVPVEFGYGSRFKRKTVDGLVYRFDHNDGVWVKEDEQEQSE